MEEWEKLEEWGKSMEEQDKLPLDTRAWRSRARMEKDKSMGSRARACRSRARAPEHVGVGQATKDTRAHGTGTSS